MPNGVSFEALEWEVNVLGRRAAAKRILSASRRPSNSPLLSQPESANADALRHDVAFLCGRPHVAPWQLSLLWRQPEIATLTAFVQMREKVKRRRFDKGRAPFQTEGTLANHADRLRVAAL